MTSLSATLDDARSLGFLGPGPVDAHILHAQGALAAIGSAAGAGPAGLLVDLGSGGGVPGLALACWGVARQVVLVERSERRARWLRRAAAGLERESGQLVTEVEVLHGQAEGLAHLAERRERADVVTARSFAPLDVSLEIASGFARTGGHVIISASPNWNERAPADEVGLAFKSLEHSAGSPGGWLVFEKVGVLDPRYPRRSVGRRTSG